MACGLSYNLSVTGDCSGQNLGIIHVDISSNITPPIYTIVWNSPFTDTIVLNEGDTSYEIGNLSAGTYTFYIQDTCTPVNDEVLVTAYISSGNCFTFTEVVNTSCGKNNGSVTTKLSYNYGNNDIKLYNVESGYVTSANTIFDNYTFGGLSSGVYYALLDDGAGCSAKTETCIVLDSDNVSFDIYVVNDAGCASLGEGKSYVTNLIGTPPYTYLWSNGKTTSSITGLTVGSYSVTVTDSTGCESSKTAVISDVPTVGLGSIFATPPTCFNDDGSVTIVVTGGTIPYYYSGSNGSVEVSFSTTHTFQNLANGPFSVEVTDAGLCKFSTSTYLRTPNGFSIVSINKINSTCFNNGGKIKIVLDASNVTFTYKLEKPNGDVITELTTASTWEFVNLSEGSYILTISGGDCVYADTIVINNISTIEVSEVITGTTCGSGDGGFTINVVGGSGNYEYSLPGYPPEISPLPTITYTNLTTGFYTYTVKNISDGCKVKKTIFIPTSTQVDFILETQDSISSNGYIQAFITEGEPPFTLEWSENVGGQTGYLVTNLEPGTYTLKITDDNGCSKTKSVVIKGTSSLSTYQIFNICDGEFENNGELGKKGPKQMLMEGFSDLTSGDINCILNNAVFTVSVSVNGDVTTDEIYVTTSLNDYPDDELWTNAVKDLILGYDGIKEVTISEIDNKITITTDCESTTDLSDTDIIVNMVIEYDISCVECAEE